MKDYKDTITNNELKCWFLLLVFVGFMLGFNTSSLLNQLNYKLNTNVVKDNECN